MIPLMIGLGLVLGQWPRSALLAAAIGWPLVLFASGVLEQTSDPLGVCLGGALLAAANAGVGILAYRALRLLLNVTIWAVGLARPN